MCSEDGGVCHLIYGYRFKGRACSFDVRVGKLYYYRLYRLDILRVLGIPYLLLTTGTGISYTYPHAPGGSYARGMIAIEQSNQLLKSWE